MTAYPCKHGIPTMDCKICAEVEREVDRAVGIAVDEVMSTGFEDAIIDADTEELVQEVAERDLSPDQAARLVKHAKEFLDEATQA